MKWVLSEKTEYSNKITQYSAKYCRAESSNHLIFGENYIRQQIDFRRELFAWILILKDGL